MDNTLTEAARTVRTHAYAPYSKYLVGAALESDDGRVFVGANVENASYGVTMCAERVALGAAVAAGARSFRRLVLVTGGDPPAAPCGACRQALSEFGDQLTIESVNDSDTVQWTLAELLPAAFGSGQLKD